MSLKSPSLKQALLGSLVITILVLATAGLASQVDDFLVTYDEVVRLASPNNRYDAVLIETNGGAATSFGYLVYLLPHKKPFYRHDYLFWVPGHEQVQAGYLYGAIRNENAYGVNLKWLSPAQLKVEYLECQKAQMSNSLRLGDSFIEVIDKSGILDESAPAGGMGYSLRTESTRQLNNQ